jgi:hypothetical protein
MRLLLKSLVLLVAATLPVAAEEEPPARVGQISYVSGNVAFHMASETQWSAAGINYPVATGGSYWTEAAARAEIQLGPNTLEMSGGTELDATKLDEQVTRVALPQGRIFVHVRAIDEGENIEIDIPRGGAWLLAPGDYDISAGSEREPSRVSVFSGSAHFVGNGADVAIKAGEAVLIDGMTPVSVRHEPAVADEFVAWCRSRQYPEAKLAAPRYVSPDMTGYEALDAYGAWDSTPEYGEVWFPNAPPADWAPYQDGRWVWIGPWGWTWIAAEPWGFAPSHFGRWARIHERWAWVPGKRVRRPVFAPALVAFIGGAEIGAAGGRGAHRGPPVGWFPLAPGEVYWPHFARDPKFIRRINEGSVKDIDKIVIRPNAGPPPEVARAHFANRRFATVVPREVFADARRVRPAMIHLPAAALERAPVEPRPPQINRVVAHPAAGPRRVERPVVGPAAAAPRPPTKATGIPAPNAAVLPPHPQTATPAHPAAPHREVVVPSHPAPPAERRPERARIETVHPPAPAVLRPSPVQVYHPPPPTYRPAAPAYRPPAPAYRPPAPAYRPPAPQPQVFRPAPQMPHPAAVPPPRGGAPAPGRPGHPEHPG